MSNRIFTTSHRMFTYSYFTYKQLDLSAIDWTYSLSKSPNWMEGGLNFSSNI